MRRRTLTHSRRPIYPDVQYIMYSVYGVSEYEEFPSPDTGGDLGLALFVHCGLFPLDDNLIIIGDPSLKLTTRALKTSRLQLLLTIMMAYGIILTSP